MLFAARLAAPCRGSGGNTYLSRYKAPGDTRRAAPDQSVHSLSRFSPCTRPDHATHADASTKPLNSIYTPPRHRHLVSSLIRVKTSTTYLISKKRAATREIGALVLAECVGIGVIGGVCAGAREWVESGAGGGYRRGARTLLSYLMGGCALVGGDCAKHKPQSV